MSKLVIIEGMDNTGKSTLISKLQTTFNKLELKVKIIHSEKPPKNIKLEDTPKYQHNYYINLVKNIINLQDRYDVIILDRAWLSEYVYGQLYRNRSAEDIKNDNLYFDKEVCDEFTDYNYGPNNTDVYMFMLLASNDFLISHEDNLSLSKCDPNLLDTERNMFNEAFKDSIIPHKFSMNVDNGNSFIDIYPSVIKNILFNK